VLVKLGRCAWILSSSDPARAPSSAASWARRVGRPRERAAKGDAEEIPLRAPKDGLHGLLDIPGHPDWVDRKLGYIDAGCLLLPGESAEIFFTTQIT